MLKRIVRSACALLVTALLLAPAASAHHADPTHGVLPHSVGTDPSGFHAVDVGTPHPYPFGHFYEYDIAVEGAETLSVHFERWEVNGIFSQWTGSCSGSEVVILDAHTGAELDRLCGEQPENDFWTRAYPTDHLTLQFTTQGWLGTWYGFDVYEVAVNGAEALASVPYSNAPNGNADPEADVTVDPFNPTGTGASLDLELEARNGQDHARSNTHLDVGTFQQCGFLGCTDSTGLGFDTLAAIDVGTLYVDASAFAYALQAGETPLDWWIPVPLVSCGIYDDSTGDRVLCPRL